MADEKQGAYVLRTYGGDRSLWLTTASLGLFAASIISYAYAELSWMQEGVSTANPFVPSGTVGVGSSTYHAIAFLRSIALALLGCGTAILAMPFRFQAMREEDVPLQKPLINRYLETASPTLQNQEIPQ